jgi:hypothetical protein
MDTCKMQLLVPVKRRPQISLPKAMSSFADTITNITGYPNEELPAYMLLTIASSINGRFQVPYGESGPASDVRERQLILLTLSLKRLNNEALSESSINLT